MFENVRVRGREFQPLLWDDLLDAEPNHQRPEHVFCEGLGLRQLGESPLRYGPGSWILTQEGDAADPIFVISGIRAPTGDLVSVRLIARAFYRAASALNAVIRELGPGRRARPSASTWNRIWWGDTYRAADGGRQKATGLMGALLAEANERRATLSVNLQEQETMT
jgi:hypothetical protein